MSTPRSIRRVAIAAVSLSALLVAAGCGGGGSSSGGGGGGGGAGGNPSGGAVDFSKKGPIEYWQGKDVSGVAHKLVNQWNSAHPNEKVTLHELPDNADAQQQQMIQNTQIKNPKMAVLSVDVVWTAQFAANQYLVPLPADQFPTTGMLKATVDSATYFNKLYAMPATSDGGLLYYRKDLLNKYKLKVPTTLDQMKADCKTVIAGEKDSKLSCFAGQYQKYEGLTVNFAEAVNGAGGKIIGDDGKPDVNTPEAQKGLGWVVNAFKDGTIPKGAITWQEEQGRQAFQKGQLVFHRSWPGNYSLGNKTDGSSQVAGKFSVAPLPGLNGPGVSSLGGHNMGIATNAANKGTAAEFIKWWTSAERQKASLLASSNAPTLESLYSDPQIIKQFPYMPILLKSIQTAQPRPKAVKYTDVTLAIQNAAYSALQGQTAPDQALSQLQTKLQSLVQ